MKIREPIRDWYRADMLLNLGNAFLALLFCGSLWKQLFVTLSPLLRPVHGTRVVGSTQATTEASDGEFVTTVHSPGRMRRILHISVSTPKLWALCLGYMLVPLYIPFLCPGMGRDLAEGPTLIWQENNFREWKKIWMSVKIQLLTYLKQFLNLLLASE
jgi:hypothetical protein